MSDESKGRIQRDIITSTEYEIQPNTYPTCLKANDRWFVWAYDDGRKIPRAPWNNPDWPEKWVSAMDEDNWISFQVAKHWTATGNCDLATCIPNMAVEENHRTRIVFIDCDDVRDDVTGDIHPQAWHLLQSWGVPIALSTSGTGLHGFCISTIPEGKTAKCVIGLKDWPHSDDPEIEFYGANRFIATTGQHIVGTPTDCPWTDEIEERVHDIFNTHAGDDGQGTETIGQGNREWKGDDVVNDIDELFDAIDKVRPDDITLKSQASNTRGDGTRDMDPAFPGVESDSGTRLGALDKMFYYRKGGVKLSPLQVVALEEGIISDIGEYPEGEDFHKAVDALRDRGAAIPKYEKPESKSKMETMEDLK